MFWLICRNYMISKDQLQAQIYSIKKECINSYLHSGESRYPNSFRQTTLNTTHIFTPHKQYYFINFSRPSIMTANHSSMLQTSLLPSYFTQPQPNEQDQSQGDEVHLAQFWNAQFPNFVFDEEIADTGSSLVWKGHERDSQSTLALKINFNIQDECSEKIHQNKQNQFLMNHSLQRMTQMYPSAYLRKTMQKSSAYRLTVMKYYPWVMDKAMAIFTTNKDRKLSQEHFSFVSLVFAQIVMGVDVLHSAGFIHRDLKPDNILLDQHFNIVLSDFGLVAKQNDVDPSICGTIEYMAPERLIKEKRNQPLKRSADVWALGIILYELYTGTTPYNGDNSQEILDQIYEGRFSYKGIPAQPCELIKKMLQVNSQKRITVTEIKQHPFIKLNSRSELLQNIVGKYL